MKIYILPVSDELRPTSQGFNWPPDCDSFGVEQDFERWLRASPYVTTDPLAAAYHFLPAYYNRWFVNHPDAVRIKDPTFQRHIDDALRRPRRTFTVCEYDPFLLQPGIDLHGMIVFSANRGTGAVLDIPLLLHPHELPVVPRVDRLATFIGHLETHPIRREMLKALTGCSDCYITNEPHGIGPYMAAMRRSLVALAPRGDGAQSYRFYEAMQAGVVPLYISDIDARPFKRWIDWDSCSLYRDTTNGLCEYLHSFDHQALFDMGNRAAEVYQEQLQYGKWCRYVIEMLGEL